MRQKKSQSRSVADAEHGVRMARAQLTASIDAVDDRLSLDTVVDEGLSYLRGDGRRYVDAIWRRAKANPLSVTLICIGLSWIAFGSKRVATTRPGGRGKELARVPASGGRMSSPDPQSRRSRVKTHLIRPDARQDPTDPVVKPERDERRTQKRNDEPVLVEHKVVATDPRSIPWPKPLPPPPPGPKSAYTRADGKGSIEDWDPIANAHSVLGKPSRR